MRDLTYLFHPWRSLSAEMIQAGRLPLWNPYEAGGMPFLANLQSSILYPPTILFWTFQFARALKIFHWLHYSLAGLGFFLLARKMRVSAWAGIPAGILFAYNGYSLTRHEFLSILGSMIWLPWALLFVLNRDLRPRFFPVALSAAAMSYSFFAGFPQVTALELAFLFSFLFIFKPWRFGFYFLFLFAPVFFLLTAAQWIPTLELWLHSIRNGAGVAFTEAAAYALPFSSILGLLSPYWISHHPDQFTGEKFFWIWSAWWGFSAAALMSFSCKFRKHRLFWLSISILGAGVLWSLGDQSPVFRLFYKFFFFTRLFRYPPVTLYLAVTGASFLLLLGAEGFRRFFPAQKKMAGLLIALLAAELWVYSLALTPTTSSEYYHLTFPAVRAVSGDQPGLVLLSPKVDRVRRLAGMTTELAQRRFRSSLYDLTNLPYRIRTVNPSGEPLALSGYLAMRQTLETAPSFSALKPVFDLWNLTHFLTEDSLGPPWKKIARDEDLNVYQNPDAKGEIFALAGELMVPSLLEIRPEKIHAVLNLEKPGVLATHLLFYPGWKLFCLEHQTHPLRALNDEPPLEMFAGSRLPEGPHEIFLVYRPGTWLLGLSLSLTGVLGLAWFAAIAGRNGLP